MRDISPPPPRLFLLLLVLSFLTTVSCPSSFFPHSSSPTSSSLTEQVSPRGYIMNNFLNTNSTTVTLSNTSAVNFFHSRMTKTTRARQGNLPKTKIFINVPHMVIIQIINDIVTLSGCGFRIRETISSEKSSGSSYNWSQKFEVYRVLCILSHVMFPSFRFINQFFFFHVLSQPTIKFISWNTKLKEKSSFTLVFTTKHSSEQFS